MVEKAEISSHKISLQSRKIKKYFINFVRAYMGDHGKSTQKSRLRSKKVNFFSTGDQSYEKKSFIFQCLVAVAVSVQIFMLGTCVIVNLQIFGHSHPNIIKKQFVLSV